MILNIEALEIENFLKKETPKNIETKPDEIEI